MDANGDQKYILSTDVVDQQQVSLSITLEIITNLYKLQVNSDNNGQKILLGILEVINDSLMCPLLMSNRPGNSAKCFWEPKCFTEKFLQKEGMYCVKSA